MNLTGVFAPVPTPFDDGDEVDVPRMRAAYPRWVDSPLSGLVVLGTTGEFGLLDDDESDLVVETARGLVPRTRTLIVGATRESTRASVRAAKRAAGFGADAVLVRSPCFFKSQMDSDALLRHYTTVADTSPVPVLLYNFSAMTGVNVLPETVAQLAEHPNIIGIKESGSDIPQLSALVTSTPGTFRVLSGSGSAFHSALRAGASGGILALACLLPEACVLLFELARDKRHEEARALQLRLLPIARLISTIHGLPGLKAALKLKGCDVGRPRPPLAPASESAVTSLRDALAAFEEVTA